MKISSFTENGDFWAIISALATGVGFIAAKSALAVLHPLTNNGYMFLIGGIFVAIDATARGKLWEMLHINFRQAVYLFIIAVMFFGSTFLLFSALKIAEPASVSFISRLELVFTILFAAILLKEKLHAAEIAGLVIVGIGILIMRYNASVELSKAILLVSLGSVIFAFAEVTIKSRIKMVTYRTFIFYRNLFMGILFFTVSTSLGHFVIVDNWKVWMYLAIAGLLLPYIGRMGYLKAMERIDISRASIIVQSQPFFAALAALVFLGTMPTLREFFGGVVIVGGVVLIKALEGRKKVVRV